ncbi:MAG: nucleotidyltransferase family protein [Lacipirellulaceae bacterium]
MHPIIEQHRKALEAACREYGVAKLELFGSAARGDFDDATSDLDFLVEFVRPGPMNAFRQYFGFMHAMEDLFCRKVDVVELTGLNNPYIRASVLNSRIPVYASGSQGVSA